MPEATAFFQGSFPHGDVVHGRPETSVQTEQEVCCFADDLTESNYKCYSIVPPSRLPGEHKASR